MPQSRSNGTAILGRLRSMLAELDRSIAVLRGEHDGRGDSSESGDAGTSLTEADHRYATLGILQRQRAAVEAAMERLVEGTYGTCVSCHQPVPPGRLEARPEAARCVACQTKHDRLRR